jgi:hypothetical protein
MQPRGSKAVLMITPLLRMFCDRSDTLRKGIVFMGNELGLL